MAPRHEGRRWGWPWIKRPTATSPCRHQGPDREVLGVASRGLVPRWSSARMLLHKATHSLQIKMPCGPPITRRTWSYRFPQNEQRPSQRPERRAMSRPPVLLGRLTYSHYNPLVVFPSTAAQG